MHSAVTPTTLPGEVISGWRLAPDSVRPLGAGLINRTFLASTFDGDERVVQQVNPVFPPAVNDDIEAVTAHLAASGLATPRLVRTETGALCLPQAGGAWRALTRVHGRSLDTLANARQAASAGALLARFHRALDDLAYEFAHQRPPIHELSRHLDALRAALDEQHGHRLYDRAARLATEILAAADALDALPPTPPRVVHGDPKINNVVFAQLDDEALCLVDLDTLGRMALPLELGDALRSWCNAAGEDAATGRFSVAHFAAAVRGYAHEAEGWVTAMEREALVPATATIQVELAARFCADALRERYFGWDPQRFPSRGEHNLVRAAGQLSVHRALLDVRGELERAVLAAFHDT